MRWHPIKSEKDSNDQRDWDAKVRAWKAIVPRLVARWRKWSLNDPCAWAELPKPYKG